MVSSEQYVWLCKCLIFIQPFYIISLVVHAGCFRCDAAPSEDTDWFQWSGGWWSTGQQTPAEHIMEPDSSSCVFELLSCACRSPTWSRPGRACVRSWGRSSSSTFLWWWARWWRRPPSNLKWPCLIVRAVYTSCVFRHHRRSYGLNHVSMHERNIIYFSDFHLMLL